MHVLLYTPYYEPATRYGGPVASIRGLARALVGLGHRVSLLTTDADGEDRLRVPLDRPVTIDGVEVHYRPIVWPTRLFRSPELVDLARRLVPTVDVVHLNGHYLLPGPLIGRLARRTHVPLVCSPRGMLIPHLIDGRSKRIKRVWINLLDRPNLAAARAIHLTSDTEAEGLRRSGLDLAPTVVIPNGIDRPEQQPSADEIEDVWKDIPSGRRVGFLARLDWTKGLDMAIAAVRSHPEAVLLIAGVDQIGLRARFEPMIEAAGQRRLGAFVGHLEGRRKWAFLAGADVLLVPSIAESFGMSVAEAMLSGTAVIATEGVGAATYLRRVEPRLVVPRVQAELDSALSDILADSERRARIGADLRRIAETELTWEPIAKRMADVYAADPRQ